MNQTSKIKSVTEFKEQSKIVLVRVDYNVDVENEKVLDDLRIKATLPTIEHLLGLNSKIILLAHLGRPHGEPDQKYTLKPVAEHLANLLSRKLVVVEGEPPVFPDYKIPQVIFLKSDLRRLTREQLEKSLNPGDIILAENIRFYPEEEAGAESFAQKIAALGDVYVNDGFSVDHHKAATVNLLPKFLPAFAGLKLLEEVKTLGTITNREGLVLLLGGVKITDKEKFMQQLLPRTNFLLLGGAMANLFLKARGYEIGDSLIEKEGLHLAREILRNHKEKVILPVDVVVATNMDGRGEVRTIDKVRCGEKIFDIGPQTILKFSQILKKAKTVVWNGPLGLFEEPQFSHGTLALGRLLASRGSGAAFVVVGGGETIQALHKTGLAAEVDFISTGGGAMLAYLGGEELPGLRALTV